ncbi:MAG TPA: penicillin-binding protein 2 [Candidatus Obscuribacterales bacterium]
MPGPVTQSPVSGHVNRGGRQPRSPLWRLRIWQLLLAAGLLVIFGRLYYLQILKGPELTQRAKLQRQQSTLLVHRGAITDRHGLPLAIDTTRYDVYVHPQLIKVSSQDACRTLAQITHTDADKLSRLFAAGHPVITVARCLGREEVDELQALNWPGVDIVPRSFRHYPEGKLAAHVLGYVNMDTLGQGGVEQAVDDSLKDTGNIKKPQLDGHGRPILVSDTAPIMEITPPLGRQIELTIDNYLQHLAEKELAAMCRHSHALRGTAILTDPMSGEILAWANYPGYDPNEYSKYPYEVTKNWSMVDVYQPGSTFKILTVACGLDTGAIRPSSVFYDGGSLKVGNRILHNHEPGGHGNIDLLHLLIHSSNVASAQIGLAMKPEQFHARLRDFGIGQRTGIDLHGESAGLLLDAKYWRPIDQATTGFGQGAVAVTPLQLVAAVGAIANGGTWLQPHVIRRIYDPRTGVTERWTEPQKRQAVSLETARMVASLLAENIARGTQLAGKVPGYRVAGKTGTAQKPNPGGRGYIPGQTIASFIGFLPADNPQLLCLVVVDSPQTDGRWGNTIAGPVFNAICVEAARYLGIPPTEPITLDASDKRNHGTRLFVAPSVLYADENPARDPKSD